MSRPRGRAGTAVAAVLAASGTVLAAPPADPPDPELDRRLETLEAEVRALREGRWLTETRVEEVRHLVYDVLADADTRASLLRDEITAGYDDGFVIGSADGLFRLEVSGQLQIRYTWNRRKDSGENDTRDDFSVRRAKVKIDGHVAGPAIGYTIGTAFNRVTGRLRLQSFNIRFRPTKNLRVLIGRARPPLLREETVSSKRQLAAERSLVASTFRQVRSLGITVRYTGEWMRVSAGFSDASIELLGNERWRASARVDVLLAGRWTELQDFTSFPGDEVTIALGGGVFYQWEDLVDAVVPDAQLFRWSADVSVELGGASLFAAYISSLRDLDDAGTFDQYGVVAQGSIFAGDDWEIFARYETGDADGLAPDLRVVTVGVNRYFRQHDLKFTMDVGYGLNEVGSFWTSRGAGWEDDEDGQDGQVVARLQFQLLF